MSHAVCFRCRRSLDGKDDIRLLTRSCTSCFTAVISSGGKNLTEYLELLGAPSVLLDQEQTILFSNSLFREMMTDHNAPGVRVGEALDCMYSGTLGRCGDTVACLLCRLKRSVEHTWLTGEGLRAVPISYPHKADSRRTFTVTTEKVGNSVLLVMGTRPPVAKMKD
ncbi:MAG: hypothetical protein ABSG38_14010 [Spirochaetia bacterium]